ncbi:Reticulon [Dillenia turbinata]|uniref:Reticulon-like protein n=1 Tax=Dillenia turbinata TaxID=194707 RepID=A0AAN8Z7J6_9MAGN
MSDSDDDKTPPAKLFGRQRPIHSVLGGGKVADVLLWRDRNVSAALLGGIAVVWFLFEVVEYNFVTLLCHISITAMLVIYIWCTCADLFNWSTPKIPQVFLQDNAVRDVSLLCHKRFNQFLEMILHIACGKDLRLFLLAIAVLWFMSVIGNFVSSMNLLFFGLLCLETLPFLYERYEEDVDYIASRVAQNMKRLFRKFDSQFLNKIPRGPVKEDKIR